MAASSRPSPLHLAVQSGALDQIDALLDAGADINAMHDKMTAMNLAGHLGNWQAVLRIAKKRKSDPGDKAQFGSALLDAIRFCEDDVLLKELVTVLLKAGAIRHRSNSNGYTTLHWAVERNKPFVLSAFLEEFPDDYLSKGETSFTPIRMAYNRAKHDGNWDCVWAIAHYAYLPIINVKKGKEIEIPEEFKFEKRIILKYICQLPPEKKWYALLDGQNPEHPLGKLNGALRRGAPLGELTTTIKMYHEEEKEMRAQGYPSKLSALRTSPQLFQSAPQKPKEENKEKIHVIESYLDGEVTPVRTSSPKTILADLFEHSPKSTTTHDDSALKGPQRFSPVT